ncbi:hypothetical protein GCM10012275_01760 [Longimycelium tulufanense]|uniref:S-adenosyl methyltransferase n=1 Tax=Longimycelium tulufanense TaxID=907463 RepID=A0A8J3FTG8_9PSEU|nr:SAM-dependent methyltransferase [Longimycelium tulufanense]GGM33993.1 hypothetical protein GCM10012275_01760 [Longimycelium tulufanense]
MVQDAGDSSDEFGVDTPSMARMRDYWLGGSHHFAADRTLASNMQSALPPVREIIWLSRSFLRRALRLLLQNGIRQFLDLGSGLSTVDPVHVVTQRAHPECRVVYVEKDPLTATHGRVVLENNDQAAMIEGDPFDAEGVLGHALTKRLLDLDRPVGLLSVNSLHFVPDSADPAGAISRYQTAVVSGSYLVLAHGMVERRTPAVEAVMAMLEQGGNPVYPRSRAEIVALFSGFDLVSPGVVEVGDWNPERPLHPNEREASRFIIVGVGRKPGPSPR